MPWTCQLPAGEAGFAENPVPDATRGMLKYDEGRQAEWRDAANRRWQLYYLRWLPTRNRYRAVEASEQARGHAPDICMSYAGMILQTNLGARILDLQGVQFQATTERFLDHENRRVKAWCVNALVDSNSVVKLLTECLSELSEVREHARLVLEKLIESRLHFGLKQALDQLQAGARRRVLALVAGVDGVLAKRLEPQRVKGA